MSPAPPYSLADLPPLPEDVRKWRILLLVSAVNSLTQRVATYLNDLGCEQVSIEIATSDESMIAGAIAHSPHVIICPFLVKKVPGVIYNNILTLIVHPGPPGDAGPAAIDWAILGDRGLSGDATATLESIVKPIDRALPISKRQRSHWGITVLQADNTFDGGPVWAFDQFPLPDIAHVTKSTLYQGAVTSATIRAVTVALTRISKAYSGLADPSHRAARVAVRVDPEWAQKCVSYGVPFMGGALHDRPQIKPGQRRPNLASHTAADVARIINCGDSQPGGTLKTARSFIFVYDVKIHERVETLPIGVISNSAYRSWDAIPAGTAIATRDGAVLFKTAPCDHGRTCSYGCGVAAWITHGRLPKAATSQSLPAKVPMAEALALAGEGERLVNVPEWVETSFEEVPGTYQQVFVRSVIEGDAVIQFVYWDFYNGAFSTTGCQHLLRALQWAVEPARGNVKILALMGGAYFSNGVALNIIESAEHPGRETWANINAIDDVVEFLAGEVSNVSRSQFLVGTQSLTERGITTVACLRGNAAAGGVALAAACDVVVSAGTVVLNPAYRAMGLHGSEFHLYSYVERCGRATATHLVKDMLPLSAVRARELGLVDVVVGGRDTDAATSETLIAGYVRALANAPAASLGSSQYPSAPWTLPVIGGPFNDAALLVDRLSENKRQRYEGRNHVPLIHYRNEELSQMLLDSFHPHRSQRYHTRRIKFVRKVKTEGTPTRFCKHRIHLKVDEEETAAFDAAPGWVRGEEWSWVGTQTPKSMATSCNLLIDFATPVPPLTRPRGSTSSGSEPSTDIHTAGGSEAIASPTLAQNSPFNSIGKASPSSFVHQERKSPTVLDQPPAVQAPQSRHLTVNPTGGNGKKSAAVSAPALSERRTQRRGSSFFRQLKGAFRSRTDLRTEALPPPAITPPSLSADSASTGSLSPKIKTPVTPGYNRPMIPNEGNTESPCLFNVTGDYPTKPPNFMAPKLKVSAA